MAIWRRKLTIPVTLRAQYGEALKQKKAERQNKEMVIRVDEWVSTQFEITCWLSNFKSTSTPCQIKQDNKGSAVEARKEEMVPMG
jgi:hypothetical protein